MSTKNSEGVKKYWASLTPQQKAARLKKTKEALQQKLAQRKRKYEDR